MSIMLTDFLGFYALEIALVLLIFYYDSLMRE